MSDDDRPDTFVDDIAFDVIGVLEKLHFLEKLDDHFCPVDDPEKRVECHAGSFNLSEKILRNLGMDRTDLDDVFAVLHSKGACCDGEILSNVASQSRVKTMVLESKTR